MKFTNAFIILSRPVCPVIRSQIVKCKFLNLSECVSTALGHDESSSVLMEIIINCTDHNGNRDNVFPTLISRHSAGRDTGAHESGQKTQHALQQPKRVVTPSGWRWRRGRCCSPIQIPSTAPVVDVTTDL